MLLLAAVSGAPWKASGVCWVAALGMWAPKRLARTRGELPSLVACSSTADLEEKMDEDEVILQMVAMESEHAQVHSSCRAPGIVLPVLHAGGAIQHQHARSPRRDPSTLCVFVEATIDRLMRRLADYLVRRQ